MFDHSRSCANRVTFFSITWFSLASSPPRSLWTLEPAHNAGGWHYANRQPFSPDPREVVNVSVVVWEEFDQLLGTHAVVRGQGRLSDVPDDAACSACGKISI